MLERCGCFVEFFVFGVYRWTGVRLLYYAHLADAVELARILTFSELRKEREEFILWLMFASRISRLR